jgi:hypothetical protein
MTKPPLNVRYIKIESNSMKQNIQISQLVVTALLAGVRTNIASLGTITSSTSINNTNPLTPVNGKTDNSMYWSSDSGNGIFWQVDLGTEYQLVEIIYYNRSILNEYADGMTINFKDGAQKGITLRNPVVLTGQLVQKFNLSAADIFIGSPNYTYAPPGYVNTVGQAVGYGYYSKAEAKGVCEAKGQRMCTKDEIIMYNMCAASWNGDGETLGYPQAQGDPFCQGAAGTCGWCGGMAPGKDGFSPWVSWYGAPAGVYCCDKDHVGTYDPAVSPMYR